MKIKLILIIILLFLIGCKTPLIGYVDDVYYSNPRLSPYRTYPNYYIAPYQFNRYYPQDPWLNHRIQIYIQPKNNQPRIVDLNKPKSPIENKSSAPVRKFDKNY
jgi:hypothetical protein